MGKTLKPTIRSEPRYKDAGLSKGQIEKFVAADLMVKLGQEEDPFYKSALDPIAEQLYANYVIAGIRDERADKAEVDDLIANWDQVTPDFLSALLRSGSRYRKELHEVNNAFCSKLRPFTIAYASN